MEAPPLRDLDDGYRVACQFAEELELAGVAGV